MRVLFSILLFLILLNSCNSKQKALELSIPPTDSLTINSHLFDSIVQEFAILRTGLILENAMQYNGDSIGCLKFQRAGLRNSLFKGINYHLNLTEFNTNDSATKQFWRDIEFHACCIPDEDLVKLKEYKNLAHFKNSASTFFIYENIYCRIWYENCYKMDSIIQFSSFLNTRFKDRHFKKLDIGKGGPTIWTVK